MGIQDAPPDPRPGFSHLIIGAFDVRASPAPTVPSMSDL
jgi:hypothetical protein